MHICIMCFVVEIAFVFLVAGTIGVNDWINYQFYKCDHLYFLSLCLSHTHIIIIN